MLTRHHPFGIIPMKGKETEARRRKMERVRIQGIVRAAGKNVVKGRGANAHVVCIGVIKGFNRDHVNMFPNNWFGKADMDKARNLKVGDKVVLSGVAKPYRRADGSKGVGLAHIALA